MEHIAKILHIVFCRLPCQFLFQELSIFLFYLTLCFRSPFRCYVNSSSSKKWCFTPKILKVRWILFKYWQNYILHFKILVSVTLSVLFFLSPFPHAPLTTLKCFRYDSWYQTCLGLSFMLCTSSPLSPDLLSSHFTIICKMCLPESLGKKVCTRIYLGEACDRKAIVLLAWETEM